MKKISLFALLACAAFHASSANAQVTIDMTKVTCSDYLAMPAGEARDFSAWMSGWFNQKANATKINLKGFATNVGVVRRWCESHGSESVFAELQRAVQAAKPASGGAVSIDTSLITCRQFLDSSVDTRMLIHAWMGGYYSSTKNLSTVDIRYVDRNARVIINYCGTHKGETLASAIEKNAR